MNGNDLLGETSSASSATFSDNRAGDGRTLAKSTPDDRVGSLVRVTRSKLRPVGKGEACLRRDFIISTSSFLTLHPTQWVETTLEWGSSSILLGIGVSDTLAIIASPCSESSKHAILVQGWVSNLPQS